jgi:hypothetical protein
MMRPGRFDEAGISPLHREEIPRLEKNRPVHAGLITGLFNPPESVAVS